MVDSAIPVARATCAMPPYPIACASVAAHTRRDRSVRTGDSAACFARRVARSTSARYYSLIRSTRSYFLTGPYWPPTTTGTFRQNARALLRGYGRVHPAVLHHAVRRTKTEIVHMIGNVEPAMNDAGRNDQHVTDLQLDFTRANRHAAATARTVRSAVWVVRAAPAVDN